VLDLAQQVGRVGVPASQLGQPAALAVEDRAAGAGEPPRVAVAVPVAPRAEPVQARLIRAPEALGAVLGDPVAGGERLDLLQRGVQDVACASASRRRRTAPCWSPSRRTIGPSVTPGATSVTSTAA
jgi:hypothetical protein